MGNGQGMPARLKRHRAAWGFEHARGGRLGMGSSRSRPLGEALSPEVSHDERGWQLPTANWGTAHRPVGE